LCAYWIPFFGPFTRIVLITVFMIKAANRLQQEQQVEPPAPVPN
jgi:hypothetical protein